MDRQRRKAARCKEAMEAVLPGLDQMAPLAPPNQRMGQVKRGKALMRAVLPMLETRLIRERAVQLTGLRYSRVRPGQTKGLAPLQVLARMELQRPRELRQQKVHPQQDPMVLAEPGRLRLPGRQQMQRL